jgi:hypothetical protein
MTNGRGISIRHWIILSFHSTRSGFGSRMGLVSTLTPDLVEDAVKRRVFGLDPTPVPD